VKNRVVYFFEECKSFSRNQYGFRKTLGTNDAIYELTDIVYKNVDSHKKTIAVFLDLSKAFDTVDHEILFRRLNDIGIRGIPLQLFRSYLDKRHQSVQINNCVSRPGIIDCGVPQGTVLGPLLFNIYINELCNLNINGRIVTFADDTVLIFAGDSWEQARETAERELNRVYKWLSENLLTLNIKKTVFMTFYLRKQSKPNNCILKIHDANCSLTEDCNCYHLESAEVVKYLGVLIDEKLNWIPHILATTKKLRQIIHKFYLLKDILSFTTLKLVYFALVQSRLQYGIMGWGGALDTHIKSLNIAQKHILKLMLNKRKHHPTDTTYFESNVFDVRQIFLYNLIMHYRKNQTHSENINTNPYETRFKLSHKILIPSINKSFGSRHGRFIGPHIINLIPEDLIHIHSNSHFKICIKEWLMKDVGRLNCNLIVNGAQISELT
jgi:hypothetical protein